MQTSVSEDMPHRKQNGVVVGKAFDPDAHKKWDQFAKTKFNDFLLQQGALKITENVDENKKSGFYDVSFELFGEIIRADPEAKDTRTWKQKWFPWPTLDYAIRKCKNWDLLKPLLNATISDCGNYLAVAEHAKLYDPRYAEEKYVRGIGRELFARIPRDLCRFYRCEEIEGKCVWVPDRQNDQNPIPFVAWIQGVVIASKQKPTEPITV